LSSLRLWHQQRARLKPGNDLDAVRAKRSSEPYKSPFRSAVAIHPDHVQLTEAGDELRRNQHHVFQTGWNQQARIHAGQQVVLQFDPRLDEETARTGISRWNQFLDLGRQSASQGRNFNLHVLPNLERESQGFPHRGFNPQ